jgi:hypothetical protein
MAEGAENMTNRTQHLDNLYSQLKSLDSELKKPNEPKSVAQSPSAVVSHSVPKGCPYSGYWLLTPDYSKITKQTQISSFSTQKPISQKNKAIFLLWTLDLKNKTNPKSTTGRSAYGGQTQNLCNLRNLWFQYLSKQSQLITMPALLKTN